ncbi:LPS translocon maturation chaperone LptM [Rosenbergiella australiborealis]|uniref:LPS translocon maturation chaperone LptM n=1 Tax=Rosenbergiella australiborealis TaxID=1544696 RepID=UPI001BD9A2B4|nr:lipoprotein [Rosenbergiella australiborealis]
MKNAVAKCTLFFAVIALAGCGLKGPLYFPKDDNGKQQGQNTNYDQGVFKKAKKKSDNL